MPPSEPQQNHNEIPVLSRSGEIGICVHCWWEEKMVQFPKKVNVE
jgi:hypothetical protein